MAVDKPCPHLAPAVNKLLAAGAEFIGVSPGGEDFRLVHELNIGPVSSLGRELAKAHNIEFWTNDDPHHSPDRGFSCRECQMAVSWPKKGSTLNAI
jgi:hypothetical protein